MLLFQPRLFRQRVLFFHISLVLLVITYLKKGVSHHNWQPGSVCDLAGVRMNAQVHTTAPLHVSTPLPSHCSTDSGCKWPPQSEMAAPATWMFWLYFCTIGGLDDVTLSIFISSQEIQPDKACVSAEAWQSWREGGTGSRHTTLLRLDSCPPPGGAAGPLRRSLPA